MSRRNTNRAGFALAPILYVLGLIGVTASVLFSGYSQVIRSNIAISDSLGVKNDLNGATQILAGSSKLGTDSTTLCPPQGASPGAVCSGRTNTLMTNISALSAGDLHAPTIYSGGSAAALTQAAVIGPANEVGVFAVGSGVKQLDPWGHYYIYCRWENSTTTGSTTPALLVITAGSDGELETNCAAASAATPVACNLKANCDDTIYYMNVGTTINHSTLWQAGTTTVGTSTVSDVTYGVSPLTVDANGNLTVPGTSTLTGAVATGTNVNVGGNLTGASGGTLAIGSSTTVAGQLTTTGAVGIGTASPGAALDIRGYSWFTRNDSIQFVDSSNTSIRRNLARFLTTADTIIFGDTDNSGQAPVNWDFAGGNVGIGTASPGAALDIRGYSWFTRNDSIQFVDSSNTSIRRNLARFLTTADTIIFGDTDNSGQAPVNWDFAGGNVGVGTTSPSGLLSLYQASSDPSLSIQNGSNSRYWINTSGNTLLIGGNGVSAPTSGGIAVLSNGNIGIGTSAPTTKFSVMNGTSGMNVTPGWFTCCGGGGTWINLDTNGPSGIGTGGAGANAWIAYVSGGGQWLTDSSAGDVIYRNISGKLLFGTTAGNSVMSISGNSVGIGTTSPSTTLTVNGTITGTVPVTDLNSGTNASATTFWRGDGTWAAVTLGTSSTVPVSQLSGTPTGGSGPYNQVYVNSQGLVTSESFVAATASQWITNGSNIYYSAGNVAIGTSSATSPLTVVGAANVSASESVGTGSANYFTINGAASGSTPYIGVSGTDTTIGMNFYTKQGGGYYFGTSFAGNGNGGNTVLTGGYTNYPGATGGSINVGGGLAASSGNGGAAYFYGGSGGAGQGNGGNVYLAGGQGPYFSGYGYSGAGNGGNVIISPGGAGPGGGTAGNVQITDASGGANVKVGIGTSAAATSLDLSANSDGTKLQTISASAGSSCASTYQGAIRYNSNLNNIEFCNGTNWVYLAAGSTSCGTPSGLSFTNLAGQSLGVMATNATPATINFSGCATGQSVSVTGAATAQISINGGTWGSSGVITSGQTLNVRMTTSGAASTTLTATVTVGSTSANWTTTTRSGSLKVFRTAAGYYPNLGGLSGADAVCQSEAGSAGYAGTYKAIMSDDSTSAKSRLTLSYPIVNASNGSTVAATNLWSGSLSNPILQPSGSNGGQAMTGSNADGSIAGGGTCTSWSSNSGSNNLAAGSAGSTGSNWPQDNYYGYQHNCTDVSNIMCIQQ